MPAIDTVSHLCLYSPNHTYPQQTKSCTHKLIIDHLLNTKNHNRFGSGATQGVIDGIDWTCKDHTEKRNKCVSNLSLGGGLSQAMNAAIDALFRCGCAVVCASGNEGRDACQGSPGSATDAYTVNAMDNTDRSASFSNYGQCTQMYVGPLNQPKHPCLYSTFLLSPFSEFDVHTPS